MAEIQIPRNEYPRPDFQRDCWESLNGRWEFTFDDDRCGEKLGYPEGKGAFSTEIVVPFSYHTPASGIGDTTLHDVVWYRRTFDLPEKMKEKRVFLHFGAVDYEAAVYLNGKLLGRHIGGYSPFCFDITDVVLAKDNLLTVRALDTNDMSQPRGKQIWKDSPFACFYWPTTGIWQPVWLEATGEQRIQSIKMTPDIEQDLLNLELMVDGFVPENEVEIEVTYNGRTVKKLTSSLDHRLSEIAISLYSEWFEEEVHYWTPENPRLYQIRLRLLNAGQLVDEVQSYFGMRKISVRDGKIELNNKPYYLRMVLDQGYWAESGLTPPTDEAIRRDVELTKAYGFNGARKHQKIEDPRYYYWCDVLGLLVWGELPSGYQFTDSEICNLTRDMQTFIQRDYNHPCLMAWIPLNESWGVSKIWNDRRQQHLGESLYHLCKAMDPTRLVSTNDGWEMVTTDIAGVHDYAPTGEMIRKNLPADKLDQLEVLMPQDRHLVAEGYSVKGCPLMMTEYGGIALASQAENGAWGYAGAEKDVASLVRRYIDVTEAIENIPEICGFCYTQLTDVYQEVNGLLDCNHEIKVPIEDIAKANWRK